MSGSRWMISPRASRWLCLAVVLLGGAVSALLVATAPTTERTEEERPPRVVQTVTLEPGTQPIEISAHGIVVPAREVIVRPEVRGRVVYQHESLVPGGYIPAGAELIHIDSSDYELALDEAEAALEQASFELAVEKGRQVVASREWKLLQGDLPENEANRSLVLREPHLRKTEALVENARSRIERAKLDLSRTRIAAPFNAMVIEESVEVGQLVERGTAVCTLVGSDEFWIRVSLPIDKLRWIRLPSGSSPGARADVFLEDGTPDPVRREGRIVRLLADLESKGRMARILVSVPDPLDLRDPEREPPLLLGSYVRVEIDAGRLEEVVSIPRAALREGNRIWVVGKEHLLEVRNVTVLWRRRDSVLVPARSIGKDEELIVSGLRTALPGMRVSPQPVHMASSGETAPSVEPRGDG